MSDLSLPSTGFLAHLSAPEREDLVRFGTFNEAARGECPIAQGDDHDCLFFLLHGKMRVLRENVDGEVALADLRAGDIFGEINILDRKPASATVRALGACGIWHIDRVSFENYLETHPAAGQKLLLELARLLARRLRDTDAKVPATSEQILDGWW